MNGSTIDNMSTTPHGPGLDCHIANDAERAAAFGNVYECWGDERPIDEYVAWRMQSVQHARATWYVGTVDGVVATSLGAYPIVLRAAEKSWPGYAIGAVHTPPEFRRRGYAATLLDWGLQQQLAGGAQFGLLYSDIKPEYYGGMGYRLCDSHYAWAVPRPGDHASSGRLEQFDPAEMADGLAELYVAAQSSRSIWIERDSVYWDWVRGRYVGHNWFWWIDGGADHPSGYIQLKSTETESRVFDWGVLPGADERAFWETVLQWAANQGVARIGGWLPSSDAIAGCFDVTPRIKELTMLSPLTAEAPWNDAYSTDAAWFTECDHI